ncbi:ABC transporter transmembrane domain-containing protein [Leptospira interrogans]
MEQNIFRFVWKHSRRDQIAILLLILLSLPFYWISLEIPKRIVNDALQAHAFRGGQDTVPATAVWSWLPDWLVGGIQLNQMQFLFALSAIYLLLVLINGGFKYAINLSKGILGERMLRRLRYDLVGQFLRFRPEEIRAIKPAEVASMVKDEVEPIGGFIGDAFIQPAFLGTQALTAMIFIMVQSIWLGLLAFVIVLLQAIVIPILRREQIRLGRERQINSRKLAGRIGELVEGAPAIMTHGTIPYTQAEIGTRLSRLFDIRANLFKRKFAVKFLNNLLSQFTPFLFFSVGGYFALTGSLDLGQLVAVIAAYRDLPPPIKELIDWDQQRMDVNVKYQQIIAQLGDDRLLRDGNADDHESLTKGPISIEGLQITDRLGTTLLDTATLLIERPAHVALVGPPGSGRSAFARALGRQISEYKGAIRIGGSKLTEISTAAATRLVAFTSNDPSLFQGSIRDNVILSLHRAIPTRDPAAIRSKEERSLFEEAMLSGNLIIAPGDDWIDYGAAGLSSPDELAGRLLEVLTAIGLDNDIYRLGLLGRLGPDCGDDVRERFLVARRTMAERLRSSEMERYVEPFDPARYNANATIGENLLFGIPADGMLDGTKLASNPEFMAVLSQTGLLNPLLSIGRMIAETTIEMFDGVAPGDPLFERYSFIGADAMAASKQMLMGLPPGAETTSLNPQGQAMLVSYALGYIEPRHRFRLLNDDLRQRIVQARTQMRSQFGKGGAIDFYEPDQFMMSASIRDNVLFGRLAFDLPDADRKISTIMREVLTHCRLDHVVHLIGLDFDVGPGGKNLDLRQRTAIDIARCLIKRPDVMVVDGALSAYDRVDIEPVLANLRREMAGRTLIVSIPDGIGTTGFDCIILFDGPRLRVENKTGHEELVS